jgi:hypothetical protein
MDRLADVEDKPIRARNVRLARNGRTRASSDSAGSGSATSIGFIDEVELMLNFHDGQLDLP